MKAKYPGTCRICGLRYEKGTSLGQDSAGLFHLKGCTPAKFEPKGTVRRPGDGGRRPTNTPGSRLYGPDSRPSV